MALSYLVHTLTLRRFIPLSTVSATLVVHGIFCLSRCFCKPGKPFFLRLKNLELVLRSVGNNNKYLLYITLDFAQETYDDTLNIKAWKKLELPDT